MGYYEYREATLRLDEKLREGQNRISSSTESNHESNLFADENDLRGFSMRVDFRLKNIILKHG
jgi:hypothetical protein